MNENNTVSTSQNIQYATFLKRVFATLLDGLLLGSFTLFLSFIFDLTSDITNHTEQILRFIYILFLPVLWFGYTLGKRAVSVRITQKDGSPISFRHSFIRTVTSIGYAIPAIIGVYFSFDELSYSFIVPDDYFPVPFIVGVLFTTFLFLTSVFLILIRKDHRSLHDLAAGTIVISSEKTD